MATRPDNDLLIIECDSENLASQRLNLGSAFFQLLNHDIAKLLLAKKSIILLRTSTKSTLSEQFARAIEQHGRFRAVLIVGHSNAEGIRIASNESFAWRVLGNWLEPFGPEIIFLAACEAGKSVAVRDLFEPLNETLREIYASPVKLYGPQAASFAVLIAGFCGRARLTRTSPSLHGCSITSPPEVRSIVGDVARPLSVKNCLLNGGTASRSLWTLDRGICSSTSTTG